MRLEAPGLKARGYRAVRHEGDSVLEEGEEEEGDEGTRPGELPGGGAHSLPACISYTPHPTLLATGEDLEVGELLWGDLVDWRQREQQLHHTC